MQNCVVRAANGQKPYLYGLEAVEQFLSSAGSKYR